MSLDIDYHRATGERSERAIDDERLVDRIRELHAANSCSIPVARRE